MKTFKEVVEKSRLEIYHDQDGESPREWSNLGKFITIDSRCSSPDKDETLISIVKETGQYATSQENHIELITEEIEDLGDKVLYITPICKYEHSGISYSIGTKHGFDYSNNGFYIVTENTLKQEGFEPLSSDKEYEERISSEIETYNQWANGDVYGFTLYDESGENEDSCGGFYSIEDIKEHLPEEFQDEDLEEYLNY